MQQIYWIRDLSKEANDFVGKKCANLGEMHNIGVPVPEGFALSVQAYEDFMNCSGLRETIRRALEQLPADEALAKRAIDEVCREIAEHIVQEPMPAEMEIAIRQFYDDLCRELSVPAVAVAVRSSGAISMPGQMETYLNVRTGDDVVHNIKKVWASGYTPRAVFWRLKHDNMDVTDARMGVAVIRMIRPRTAGVGFTVDPNTGSRAKVMIEANWGVGESIVQGLVTPDVYYIDKRGLGVTHVSIGEKLKRFVLLKDGCRLEDVPVENVSIACISTEEASCLANFGMRLEDHFSCPQDFEWAIDDETGKIYLVQTRPAKHIPEAKSITDVIVGLMKQKMC